MEYHGCLAITDSANSPVIRALKIPYGDLIPRPDVAFKVLKEFLLFTTI